MQVLYEDSDIQGRDDVKRAEESHVEASKSGENGRFHDCVTLQKIPHQLKLICK